LSWKKWLGPLLSLVFLGVVLLNHDLHGLLAGVVQGDPKRIFNPDLHLGMIRYHLLSADYHTLMLAGLITILQFPVRAYRWKFLLMPRKRIRFLPLLSATMIGFMANNILPARLGEFVRAYMISRSERISGSSAMATIVVERLFDGMALLTVLLVVFRSATLPGWVHFVGWLATGDFLVLLVFLVSMLLWPERFARGIAGFIRLFSRKLRERTEALILRFISGLEMLRDRRLILIVIGLSLVHWLILGVGISLGLAAFGIEVPPTGPYFVLSIVSLGVALPSAPGFIGTFQLLVERSLSVYGVSKDLCLSFSTVFHAILILPTTLIGLGFFLREHLTWKELKRTEARLQDPVEEPIPEE